MGGGVGTCSTRGFQRFLLLFYNSLKLLRDASRPLRNGTLAIHIHFFPCGRGATKQGPKCGVLSVTSRALTSNKASGLSWALHERPSRMAGPGWTLLSEKKRRWCTGEISGKRCHDVMSALPLANWHSKKKEGTILRIILIIGHTASNIYWGE